MNARKKGFGGFPGAGGGSPRNLFGGAAGLILLGGGALLVSNSLFNGRLFGIYQGDRALTSLSRWWSQGDQIHQNRWCEARNLRRRYAFKILYPSLVYLKVNS